MRRHGGQLGAEKAAEHFLYMMLVVKRLFIVRENTAWHPAGDQSRRRGLISFFSSRFCPAHGRS
ncbi:hypothetical protein BC362_28110 [Ensifer sp. LC14]|nr:hypothetical protein BC362_28110 [Ensifer sp. LC14]